MSAENDAGPCEVHVPGRDRPSPWCAACRMSVPEYACVCPPDICLGTDSDSGMRVECKACLVLDPELPCLQDELDGGIRGTVADAVDFARECSEEWGVPVVVRVDERRTSLPPIIARRADHDGPTWVIRPRPIPYSCDQGGRMSATETDRSDVEELADVLRRADDDALVRTNFEQIVADYDETARAVLASDWLAARDARVAREAAARAWDEGWEERDNDCSEPYSPHRQNPYRAEATQ